MRPSRLGQMRQQDSGPVFEGPGPKEEWRQRPGILLPSQSCPLYHDCVTAYTVVGALQVEVGGAWLFTTLPRPLDCSLWQETVSLQFFLTQLFLSAPPGHWPAPDPRPSRRPSVPRSFAQLPARRREPSF